MPLQSQTYSGTGFFSGSFFCVLNGIIYRHISTSTNQHIHLHYLDFLVIGVHVFVGPGTSGRRLQHVE